MTGPLSGLRVIELGGIGPGPHAAMILGDLGAEVVRVDRADIHPLSPEPDKDQLLRNRWSVTANLKDSTDSAKVSALIDEADVLLEGFRPGVAERLSLGPQDCLRRNRRLVYARMTGWGQEGPMARQAGHDLNYVAMTGVLSAIARDGQPPTVPLNLVGDYGGGSMLLLVGVLAALWEREKSGQGQEIDAAMVDGVALLSQAFWSLRGRGEWANQPASNVIDGGAPFYDVYECADGEYVAVAPLEPAFYANFLAGLGLYDEGLPSQFDRTKWPYLKTVIARAVKSFEREELLSVFQDSEACVTPVLTFNEAEGDALLRERKTLIEVDGVTQAAPAPRFSRTPSGHPRAPRRKGQDNALLRDGWPG